MISIGSLYHLIPKVFGRPQMHSIGLINAHFWLATIGTVLYIYRPVTPGVAGSSPVRCAIHFPSRVHHPELAVFH